MVGGSINQSMKDNLKILICVWGNPVTWRKIKYDYKGKILDLKDPIPLVKDVENPHKIIVVVADTLFDNIVSKNKTKLPEEADEIYEGVEKWTRNWIRSELHLSEEPEIFVCPGKGEFSSTLLDGNPRDFYRYLLYKLCFFIVDEIRKNRFSSFEFIIDITHGMNYTTVYTYEVVIEVARLLSFAWDVRVKVLNSDPLVGQANPEKLNINEIEFYNVQPNIEIFTTGDTKILSPFSGIQNNKEKGRLGRELSANLEKISQNMREIIVFLSSFKFGMPQYVFYFFQSSDIILDYIKNSVEFFMDKFKIMKSSGKIIIARQVEFAENFSNLAKAYFVASMIENSLEGINFDEIKGNITLDKVKRFKDKFLKKLPIEKNRLDREIDELKSIENSDWKLLGELKIKENSQKGSFQEEKPNKRNFFAHAGFEWNSIHVRKSDGDVQIKINEKFLGDIEDLLYDNLPKLR